MNRRIGVDFCSSDPGPAANPACYGSDTGMNATSDQVPRYTWVYLGTKVPRYTWVVLSTVLTRWKYSVIIFLFFPPLSSAFKIIVMLINNLHDHQDNLCFTRWSTATRSSSRATLLAIQRQTLLSHLKLTGIWVPFLVMRHT